MTATDVAILGSNATGLSLALACAEAGLRVTVCEPDPHARERAEVFAQKDNAAACARVSFSNCFAPAEKAAFLFDALEPEDRASVQCRPESNTVIATPYIVAPGFGDPAQKVRFVPYQPMHLRHLVELARFSATCDGAIGRARTLASRIDRVPVVLPAGAQSPGLRLLDALQAAADTLLLEGAILWELDEAMTRFGFDLGFYEAQDLTGLDAAYARRRARNMPSLIADRAVQEGRIGKKIGWGWYRYPGGGGAVIDPLIEDLIREEAWFSKTPQRGFSDAEVIERLLATLRDEVQAILEAVQVGSPEDLSRILVHGLGFPSQKLDVLALPAMADQRGSSAG